MQKGQYGTIMSPRVGIVIPAFNVENYVGECIESILGQTYKNITVVIINDGSTDKTWEIIQNYIVHNPSVIRGINSENRGVMQARYIGIKHLEECEYILFVDADDYLMDAHIVQKCVNHMNASDMVCFNAEKKGKACFKQNGIQNMTRIDGIKNILNRRYFDGNMWGGCYKYWYVRKYFRPQECNNDDYVNKAAFVKACDRITVIPDIGYYYRMNSESQTNRKVREMDYMYYDHVCQFCRTINQQYSGLAAETEYFEGWVLLWLVMGLHKNKESRYLKIYDHTMEEFKKHSKVYLQNQYFSNKDRFIVLCIKLHIFRVLYMMYQFIK